MLDFIEKLNNFAERNDLQFWFRYKDMKTRYSECYFFDPKTGKKRDYTINFTDIGNVMVAANQIISDMEHNYLKNAKFH